jgi:hypothetical protein
MTLMQMAVAEEQKDHPGSEEQSESEEYPEEEEDLGREDIKYNLLLL